MADKNCIHYVLSCALSAFYAPIHPLKWVILLTQIPYREAEAGRPQRIPSPHPRILDPAPVNTGMNRLKPQLGLALLPTPSKEQPLGLPLPSL